MNIQPKIDNFYTNKYLCFLKNYKIYILPIILVGCLSILINIVCIVYIKRFKNIYEEKLNILDLKLQTNHKDYIENLKKMNQI